MKSVLKPGFHNKETDAVARALLVIEDGVLAPRARKLFEAILMDQMKDVKDKSQLDRGLMPDFNMIANAMKQFYSGAINSIPASERAGGIDGFLTDKESLAKVDWEEIATLLVAEFLTL